MSDFIRPYVGGVCHYDGPADDAPDPRTVAARVAAHQRARILRDAAVRLSQRPPARRGVIALTAAADRQERIGNGEQGQRVSSVVPMVGDTNARSLLYGTGA